MHSNKESFVKGTALAVPQKNDEEAGL